MLFAIVFNLRIVISSLDQLGDFGSFIAAGNDFDSGLNPYGTTSPLIFEAHFPLVSAGGKLPNLNPPISLLFFKYLSGSNYIQMVNTWRGLSFLIYAASILILANHYKPSLLRILWGAALAGLWHTIGLGQIYTLVLFLVVLIWISSLRRNNILTGILLGLLVSFKPNFIIWLLLLAIKQNWKALVAATLTIIGIGLTSLLVVSPQTYVQWLETTQIDSRIISMPGNSSLVGLTSRLGYPEIGAILAVFLLIITAIFILRTSHKLENQTESVNSTGIMLSLLASPISWVGYTILMLPFFISQKKWSVSAIIAAAILTVPFNFTMHFYYSPDTFNFVFWGWWYGIALVICYAIILLMWSNDEFEHKWL